MIDPSGPVPARLLLPWLMAALTPLLLSRAAVLAEPPLSEVEKPADLLKQHGIEPTVDGVLKYLRQWQPGEEQRRRVAALIAQLGSDSFQAREDASRQLGALGVAALVPLRAAAQSSDPEVAGRARRLLGGLDQAEQDRLAERVLIAALHWLGQSRPPEATGALLDLLPNLPNAPTREAACAALWACARPADAARLRRAVEQGPAVVRAAAIPALELAAGEEAVPALRGFLKDRDERVRLAAARALLDRLRQPSVAALLGLTASTDPDVRVQAAWLLQQVSGIPPADDHTLDLAAATRRWQAWREADAGEGSKPLGRKRLQTSRYGVILSESFAEAVGAIGQTYHQLRYESNVGGKASVSHGVLRLDGHHGEGDQRLFVSSEKLLGLPSFPRKFQIKALLGGEAEGVSAWHVGVSVGNIRVLFHPGLEGGGFRAERVDNHLQLFPNETMPFTPAAGVLQEMTIDVEKGDDGAVTLDVVLVDGSGSGRRHRHTLKVEARDIGDLNRVGLERSGRTGGAALFGPLVIRH